MRGAETTRTHPLPFYLCHSYVLKSRTKVVPVFLFTNHAIQWLFHRNSEMASPWPAGHMLVPRFGLLLHIGSGPDGVFGVQLLKLLEKDISELIRLLCIESVQQFLTLVVSELMTEVV